MRRSTVVIELATDTQFARDLAAGGVFVPGCTLRLTEECDLVVRAVDHELVLPARVVYVDQHRGAGLELVGFSTEMREQLTQLAPFVRPSMVFVEEPVVEESDELDRLETTDPDVELARPSTGPVPLVVLAALEDDLSVPVAEADAADTAAFAQIGQGARPTVDWHDDEETTPADRDDAIGMIHDHRPIADDDGEAAALAALQAASAAYGEDDVADDRFDGGEGAVTDENGSADEDDGGATDPEHAGPRSGRSTGKHAPRNVHERLRGLNLAAQIKLAVNGELHERIVLERLYGKNVWETLLRNPRLSPPEVSRIARYGSLPRVLLEIIVSNNAWLQVPEIRRALLSNPRLGADQIMKVLRLTPKHELKLAAIQTAYPIAVRNAAKMILRSES